MPATSSCLNGSPRTLPDSYPFYPHYVLHRFLLLLGRNPAVMAAYCRRILGKKDVLSMYLSCSPRVQARRFLTREVDKAATDRLEMYLGLQTYVRAHCPCCGGCTTCTALSVS